MQQALPALYRPQKADERNARPGDRRQETPVIVEMMCHQHDRVKAVQVHVPIQRVRQDMLHRVGLGREALPVVRRGLAFVPDNFQTFARAEGGPGRIGDDRDAGQQAFQVAGALDLLTGC